MKKHVVAAAIAASFFGPVHATEVHDNFTSFYSFGDSLTDDGKFGLLEPPSFGGRFTNGPTWSEYIEDEFEAVGKDTRNYALGGATAGDLNLLNPGPLATFGKQIDAFMAELPAVLSPGGNPLVSLWFGANDIFQGVTSPALAADAVLTGVREIAAIPGQSFDDFLIFDLPSIPGSPGQGEAFNTQLDANIATLRDEGLNIIRFDPAVTTQAVLEDVFNGSPLYGITELLTPCAISFSDGDPSSCLDDGKDPNTFFFADTVHPSAPVHLLTSQQVSATIIASNAAVVPLPAGAPLMLAGLAAFAWMRRRQKAA